MGARVTRVFRNFNLENRVLRELSKDKPSPAPRHQASEAAAADMTPRVAEAVKEKNEPLLAHLRSVYVDSTAPPEDAAEVSKKVTTLTQVEWRPLRYNFPGNLYGLEELTEVPKGKLTIAEALKALGSHQHRPHTWTPERIAQEFSLELKDTEALVEFFVPFKVEIIPPKTKAAKQLKAS